MYEKLLSTIKVKLQHIFDNIHLRRIVDVLTTAGDTTKYKRGEVLGILHQFAYEPNAKTIYSSSQLAIKNTVNDRSIHAASRKQLIHTNSLLPPTMWNKILMSLI